MLFFQLMQVSQQMHPTALVHAQVRVVAAVEITHHHAFELLAQDLFDDTCGARLAVDKVTQALSRKAPDIAVLTTLSPRRLIAIDHRRATNLLLDRFDKGFAALGDALNERHQLPDTDAQVEAVMEVVL